VGNDFLELFFQFHVSSSLLIKTPNWTSHSTASVKRQCRHFSKTRPATVPMHLETSPTTGDTGRVVCSRQ